MPRPRFSPERTHAHAHTHTHTLCASLRGRNATQNFTRTINTEIYSKNAAPQIGPRTRTHTLCELAQSKWQPTCHKGRFMRNFKGQMPSHFVRKFTVQCRSPAGAPYQAPAFTPTVKSPQRGRAVWGKAASSARKKR